MRSTLIAMVLLGTAVFGQRNACERACLENFIDQYLDSSRLPLARGVKYIENGQRLELNDGPWNRMSAKGSYRLFVDNVPAGQAAFIGTIREADAPATIAVRLKTANRQTAEIEAFMLCDLNAAKNLEEGRNRPENGNQTANATLAAEGKQRPDPKTATDYSSARSRKEQFGIRTAAFCEPYPRLPFRGHGPGARPGVQLHLLRSCRGQNPNFSNSGWASGDSGSGASMDLGIGGNV